MVISFEPFEGTEFAEHPAFQEYAGKCIICYLSDLYENNHEFFFFRFIVTLNAVLA